DVDHDLAILDAILTPQTPKAGRNEPCPCGSGRKYKHCHLGVDETALADRLTWLYRKANWWLGFRHRNPVQAMAWVLSRHRPETPEELVAVDPLIADVALTEDGFFDEWLSERGALLPSDEALLAHAWALVRRSVFQVTDVRAGAGMTVRDVRTGDVVDVDERSGSRGLHVGEYVLVRPLPTGDGRHQFFGGITRVPDVMLDQFLELLDTDPNGYELLRLVAESEAPPTMVNRDGDEVVPCETTWGVADPDAARATLTGLFGTDDATADAWTWTADVSDEPDPTATATGSHTVRGSLHLSGDLLVAETNSVERAERLRNLIETHLVDATLIEALQFDADDVADDRAYERDVYGDEDDAEGGSGLLDPVDAPPEVQAALRQQIDAYEDAWVDEPIPALGGATPRQALDDPTRRDDLLRLLEDMERRDAALTPQRRALGMRPARLRELLGL
ncbi:MAG TPA: SEC-C domain-containing protein, partial [Acidimicrobiales bacterium]|nr:SEC-C domain-containing protein [Acidimicrobiales bacterium]